MPFAGAMAACSILLLLLLAPFAEGEGQSSEATSEGFTMEQTLSENGCGAFAGLVAATAGTGEAFREQIAGGGAGLTVFCPDDEAVAAFGPGRFGSLGADEQVALLLYHGVAALYSEEALRAADRVVATLAGGPEDDVGILVTRDYGGTVILCSLQNEAGVTKMAVADDRLIVYLVDAVLVPGEPAARGPYSWVPILVLCLVCFGLPLLVVLLAAILPVVGLLRRLCQDCAAAHASAARVAPHG